MKIQSCLGQDIFIITIIIQPKFSAIFVIVSVIIFQVILNCLFLDVFRKFCLVFIFFVIELLVMVIVMYNDLLWLYKLQ